MKKIILFTLLALAINARAQTGKYFSLPDSNVIWKENCLGESEGCASCCSGTGDYYCLESSNIQEFFNGDTIIGAYTYKKLFYSAIDEYYYDGPIYCSPGCVNPIYYTWVNQYEGAIRQDTNLRKVFIVPSHYTNDTLLYDFNMNVGDTLSPSFISYTNSNYVSKIDSVLVGGNFHKRFWICSVGSTCDSGYVAIIEGVGSTYGLLIQLEPAFEESCSLCVNLDSNVIYSTIYANCAIINISIKDYSYQLSYLILPNPATTNITIITSEEKQTQILIENIEGQTILQFTTSSLNTNIDVSALARGMYFIKVKTEKGVAVKKFIKE